MRRQIQFAVRVFDSPVPKKNMLKFRWDWLRRLALMLRLVSYVYPPVPDNAGFRHISIDEEELINYVRELALATGAIGRPTDLILSNEDFCQLANETLTGLPSPFRIETMFGMRIHVVPWARTPMILTEELTKGMFQVGASI